MLGAAALAVAPGPSTPMAHFRLVGGNVDWQLDVLSPVALAVLRSAGPSDPHIGGDQIPDEAYAALLDLIDRGLLVPHPKAWKTRDAGRSPIGKPLYCSYVRAPSADKLLEGLA